MRNYLLYGLFLSVLFMSCEEENLNNIAENQFVVEAFLYANEAIDDIRIKTTFPLADEEDTSSPINDAEVTLIKGGERFLLEPAGDQGFYYYPGTDVQVETGDLFQLEVIHNGITARAETMVPTPTTGLQISQDSIKVPQLPFSAGREAIVEAIRAFLLSSSIVANWDNPNQDLYFMVVESVKDTIDPIFPGAVLDALERFRFVSEPTDEASLEFLAGTLVSFGTYAVKVYHINQEYAQLYENRQQDSRDLNEPPSNVENALGVFSAFNSQEVYFEVVRE
ncbi:MAG: DUF4249 family protein [Saprospiraceae bacterium]|nr:DUF4249 family protein [Saprospiraceae bacterium]